MRRATGALPESGEPLWHGVCGQFPPRMSIQCWSEARDWLAAWFLRTGLAWGRAVRADFS
jgi:hypothetical protein